MSTGKGTETGAIARIKQAMVAHRFSIRSLSRDIGVPYRTLQNYLAGLHSMPIEVLGKICRRLSISADWVLHDGLFLPMHDLAASLERAGLVTRENRNSYAIMVEGYMNLINDRELLERDVKHRSALEKQVTGDARPRNIDDDEGGLDSTKLSPPLSSNE